MLEFEGLSIDYADNLPLMVKIAYERLIPNFIERFSYNPAKKTLHIPKRPRPKSLQWIITSINHEFLHHILNELENSKTTICFDSFSYQDIVSGIIDREPLETI